MAKPKAETTVPVMANRAPWNEIVLQGKRKIKTLSFNLKHRGLMLLYTSSNRQDDFGWDAYGLQTKDLPKGAIVGYVNVINVMLTDDLIDDFFHEDPALYDTTGQPYVAIVSEPKRFKKPIPFKPPKGAVRFFRAPAKFLNRATVSERADAVRARNWDQTRVPVKAKRATA